MRSLILITINLFFLLTKAQSQCATQSAAQITYLSCYGSSDGAIQANIVGDTADISNPGVLLSEIFTDPAGNDSPFEWVELIATKVIDFSINPYTIIVSNNGLATANGWTQGGAPTPPPNNSTYAFQIDSGIVRPGDVFYVGGINMAVSGRKLRIKNTVVENGDGGIGSPFLSSGVIGNGGGIADGVAVFNKPVNQLNSSSIPVDAIFFGTGIGSAATVDTSKGFTLPSNDNYPGGHLKLNSYCAPEILGKFSIKANGRYHCNQGIFVSPRSWSSMTVAGPTGLSDVAVDYLEYQWSTGATTKSISNLSANTYTLTVTKIGANPCSSTFNYQIYFNGYQVSISFGLNLPTCSTANNGSLYAYVSGLNYYSTYYTWSNGESGYYKNNISNLTPGNYSVTVSDGNSSCLYSNSILVGDMAQYPLPDALSNTMNCPGDSSGYAYSQITNQYGSSYSYLWSNGQTGSYISQLPAGIYTLTVTDGAGCSGADTVWVRSENPVIIDSVRPAFSSIGFPVTIYGKNLNDCAGIYFNNVHAPLISQLNDTAITVIIPEEADTGKITIKTKNNCLSEGPVFYPVDRTGILTLKLFYEGLYIQGGYMNSPLINSGVSGYAPNTDVVNVALRSTQDMNRIVHSMVCTLNTQGICEVRFPVDLINQSYWISISGRNVINTWSKSPVTLGSLSSYDFTSDGMLQGVITLSVDSVQYTNASARIQLVSPIIDSISLVGICWGTEKDPAIELEPSSSMTWSGDTTPIAIQINDLVPGKKYHARAFASTSKGIVYGNGIEFTTEFILMDADGNVYDTVQIGPQTWMKQNLATSKYRDGSPIPFIIDNTSWTNACTYQRGGWSYYDTLPSNNTPFGKLYNFYAINDTALCPIGWHVPGFNEWNELIGNLGGQYIAGNALKDTGTTSWSNSNLGATNSSGFTALPGGYWEPWSGYSQMGFRASFRSSDGNSIVMNSNSQGVSFEYSQCRSESVRCIKDRVPSVLTSDAVSKSSNRLFVGGYVNYVDGVQSYSRGVCWSTQPQPTISLSTKIYSGNGEGSFQVDLPNLNPSTVYYYRAFCSNGNTVVYGPVKQAKTNPVASPGQVVDIDGFAYDTVNIGSQTWLKQNLRTTRYLNGVRIPEVTSGWYGTGIGAYCYYHGDPGYDSTYGKLYNYFAVNDTLVCPTGYHVPSYQECANLVNFLGGQGQAGPKLKETGSSHWLTTNTNVNNQSGFTALPAGIREYETYRGLGSQASFLTQNGYTKFTIDAYDSPYSTYFQSTDLYVGASIRCIKNTLPELSMPVIEGLNSSRVFATAYINYDGGMILSSRGFCFGTSPLPTLGSSILVVNNDLSNPNISNEIRNLNPGTTYYLRAYATNSEGTNYGPEIYFTTRPIAANQVADIDGNVYGTARKGNHRIMTSNLRVRRYNNGDAIGIFNNSSDRINAGQTGKGAYFYTPIQGDSLYGLMYNWYAINDTAICPIGWHIPKKDFWLYSSGGTTIDFSNQGYYLNYPYWHYSNYTPVYFWTKDESGSSAFMSGGSAFQKDAGMTVRCINDTTPYQYTFQSYKNIAPGVVSVKSHVQYDGGVAIIEKGFCWSSSPSPTINDQHLSIGSDTGTFQASLSNLNHNTLYYIRPYATNSIGTSYGPQVSILTLATGQVADFEGNRYDTVHIGNRVWLKQNLRTRFYRDGQGILQAQGTSSWMNITQATGAWAYYNNDSSLAASKGLLYNWLAVNDTAICPAGYRIPGDSDWNELILSLDPAGCVTCQGIQSSIAGGALKSNSAGSWNSPNTGATNSSGFTAVGAGSRNVNGQDSGIGNFGFWWSSSPISNGAWMRYVDYNSGAVTRNTNVREAGYSVRCVNE